MYTKGAIISLFLLWLLGQPVCVHRYFETFDVVSEVATEERLKMAGMLGQCSSQEERGEEGGRERESDGRREGGREEEMEGGKEGGRESDGRWEGEMGGGRNGGRE